MQRRNFVLRPISTEDASALRRGGGPSYIADEYPGYPCRQCLSDAQVGEALILVSHDPFIGNSAYRSASPIFLHRDPCGPPQFGDELPTQLTSRALSVRSFDKDEMMLDGLVIDGDALGATLTKLIENPSSDKIHIHNASRGCWAVSVERANFADS